MKLPSFQFYPADWRKDPGIRALSFHDRAVWFELLCLMHESPRRGYLMIGEAAMTDEVAARILGMELAEFMASKASIVSFGVGSVDDKNGALFSRRMVKDTKEIVAWKKKSARAGRNSAKSRNHHGIKDKGGKFTTEPKPEPSPELKPNSSSSSSSSSSDILLNTAGAGEADAEEDSAGTEPPIEKWVAHLARFSVPRWYAEERHQAFHTKGWHSGHTPLFWKRLGPLMAKNFVNKGGSFEPPGTVKTKPEPSPGDMAAWEAQQEAQRAAKKAEIDAALARLKAKAESGEED